MAAPNPTRVTELGVERMCRGCGEYWPTDGEFWYMQNGKIMGRCKACWHERFRAKDGRTKFPPLIGV